jgi:hypothetical protein
MGGLNYSKRRKSDALTVLSFYFANFASLGFEKPPVSSYGRRPDSQAAGY